MSAEEIDLLKAENERLREHNATLLAEKRDAVAASKSAETALASAEAERSTLTNRLNDALLSKPVELLLHEISSDPYLLRLLLNEQYAFKLGDDDKPRFVDKSGNEVMTVGADGAQRAVTFDSKDIAEFLVPEDSAKWTDAQKRFASVLVGSRASGSGAKHGVHDGARAHIEQPQQKQAEPLPQFGLR